MTTGRMFRVDFKSPTTHRGARVTIEDLHYGTKITLGYDYEKGNITSQAINHLGANGIPVKFESRSIVDGCTYLFATNFAHELRKDV